MWLIPFILLCWVVIIWALVEGTRDLVAWQNRRALDGHDGFTPSVRRWGYVGEQRGAK
jgi:hypothetical protein